MNLNKCELCPRMCKVNREAGEVGFCGAGKNARIARAALHFWEEPVISGTKGSGAVFFSNCTMKCVFCQNYEISAESRGRDISSSELSDIFLKLQAQGAHNINLVTPTHYIPQITEALQTAKENGLSLPIVYNTSGYERVEVLRTLDGLIDVYLPDLKYFSDKYAVRYSGTKNYFKIASEAIDEMYRRCGDPIVENGILKRGVLVRHLMLPSLLFDTKKIIDYLFEKYGNKIYISLMSQYTPMPQSDKFPELARRLDERHYSAMVDYCAERGIVNAFVQDFSSADENFIPDWNES